MRKFCLPVLIISFFFFCIGYFINAYIDSDSPDIIYSNPLRPLDIETYDGGGEGLHPKCLFFPNGWNGARYWFVFTPYKGMNEAIENPCIYTSNNGEDFTPVYSAFPIDNITLSKEDEYNSDPHLVFNYDLNRIECWWRRVYTGNYPDEKKRYSELLYRSYSYDGEKWSTKELIFEYKNQVEATRGIICPVVCYEGGKYLVWVSSSEEIDGTIRYIDCYQYSNEGTFYKINRVSLKDCVPSHFDVLKKGSMYYLCAQDVGSKGFSYKLFVSSSPCDDFESCGLVFTPGPNGNWDSERLYRPSLTIVEDEWWLYYSAYLGAESHVGLLKFNAWSQIAPQIVNNDSDVRRLREYIKRIVRRK